MTATRDRYGDAIEDGATEVPAGLHSPDCTGWLGEDNTGRPVPCLVCKPYLATKGRRQLPTPGGGSVVLVDGNQKGTGPARHSRETASDKARRLLAAGRLHITTVTVDSAQATCVGDTGTHRVSWARATGWSCTCPACGPRCSHITALRLVTTRTQENP